MKNERTSAKAAAIAGRVLEWLKGLKPDDRVTVTKSEVMVKAGRASDNEVEVCTVAELKQLAASCLTQAENKTRK